MKASVLIALLLSAFSVPALAAGPSSANLCYNGSFSNHTNMLDGWMIDYQWTGNNFYKQNHTRISALQTYEGKKGVMCVDGRGGETKVESPAIPFETGARYRCTIVYKSTAQPHIYFAGYKWNPGIRPYANPHLGDLRKIYKSEFRNHKMSQLGGGWKSATFEFPMPNLSKLALDHLKYIRFITVYFIFVDGSNGQGWIDDVTVTRIQ